MVPVRDFVILPTFNTVEHVVQQVASPEKLSALHQNHLLPLIRSTPLIGEPILEPALNESINIAQFWWKVIQYPIPSKALVGKCTDQFMTNTKNLLQFTSREIYFYTQLLDQSLTRTLMHTQWRVLGVGPYANLSERHRLEVIDLMCERYFSIENILARYELTAHIKKLNSILYHDLVASGLLLERCLQIGDGKVYCDIWLRDRHKTDEHRLEYFTDDAFLHSNYVECNGVVALWYYESTDGTGSTIDKSDNNACESRRSIWLRFSEADRISLEDAYIQRFRKDHRESRVSSPSSIITSEEGEFMGPIEDAKVRSNSESSTQWYEPDLESDILVDEYRYAVSLLKQQSSDAKISMIMRPILWRFYGRGRDVRRGTWLLEQDNNEKKLLPYNDESSAILEDAFMFLKWHLSQKSYSVLTQCYDQGVENHVPQLYNDNEMRESNNHDTENEATLLTVNVIGPDGEEQLIQFRSLSQVIAIPKTLGGGLTLFKKRVYRGVCISSNDDADSTKDLAAPLSFSENFLSDAHITKSKPCNHLALVVHGIGEMMNTVDLFGLALPPLSSIVDCCTYLRKNHSALCKDSPELNGLSLIANESNSRVEYIPIEWHEKFNSLSRQDINDSTNPTLRDITLNTIPYMRALANDTLLDVMYFMAPEYHQLLIDIVSEEMNLVVGKVRKYLGQDFSGKISIIGHSLGSIISWDILSNQIPSVKWKSVESPLQKISNYPQLTFEPTCLFMIGAPMPVFLLLRNPHNPLPHDYQLPTCRRVFNVFHPFDPVAYRIEPLINPKNAKIEAKIIPHWKGGYRMQYQTKLLWKNIVNQTQRRHQSIVEALEAGIRNVGLLDDMDDDDDSNSVGSTSTNKSSLRHCDCGVLNGGKRIDHMLQESEVETANEYVFALGAHSAYWAAKDFAMFIAKELVLADMDSTFDDHSSCSYSISSPTPYGTNTYKPSSELIVSPLPAWESF